MTKDKAPKRFIFMAAWVTEESFKELVKNSWKKNEDWPSAISHFTGSIIEWNIIVFGNIISRKKSLLKRLNGIDKYNPKGTNKFLNQLQLTL